MIAMMLLINLQKDIRVTNYKEEAKAQNIAVDEVILRETLFTADQKTLKFRNEKIDGDNVPAR